jgi:ketosteroid isomerase-like protein
VTSELDALHDRRRAWVESVSARDVERYAELVTEDVVWLPPAPSRDEAQAQALALTEESFDPASSDAHRPHA